MSSPSALRLPVPIASAAQRIKLTTKQAVDRSIESLGLAALSASSVSQRSEILAAQFELDRKSAAFALAFDDAFDKRLCSDCLPRQQGGARETDWADLSLMDDHELEVKVAAERFGLQMAHACEWELRELNGFLASVLPQDPHEAQANPLRPELVGLAMIQAVESITPLEDSRRVLKAELARSLASMLGATYAAIAADMRAQGIQPAGLTVRMTENRSAAPNAAFGAAGGPDDAAQEHANSGNSQFMHSGRGASSSASGHGGLSSRSGIAPSPTGGRGRMGHVDANMMSLIRRLAFVDTSLPNHETGVHERAAQETAAPDSASGLLSMPMNAPNLIHAHRDELRAASSGGIDHMVIDVIGGLFDQILSDPKVPPQMARQIARLQLPVLRAALGDPAFFSSRRHPVRRFVNRLASVGSALPDLDDERGQRFMAKVAELVQAVVQGDFEQVDTYESKLAALETFVVDDAQQDAASMGDAVAVLQAKEDQLRLQGLYAQQLSGALKELDAPEFLRDFVAQVWSQVLLKAAASSGVNSEPVLRLRQTGHELLMSVQPKTSAAQRKVFLSELPKLMQALGEGMDLITVDAQARRAFFAQLLPAHAEALKNTGARTLDFNLMAKRVEGALAQRLPSSADLPAAPAALLAEQADKALTGAFSRAEAKQLGLLSEASVDWDGKLDIDLSEEPELNAADVHIKGLPSLDAPEEPTRGKTLADHVQIGFAYQMHLQGKWEKVRLAHVSSARTFFVFHYGKQQRESVSFTHRMLTRLCDTGRMRAFESAYLIERATARARRQLADLGARSLA